MCSGSDAASEVEDPDKRPDNASNATGAIGHDGKEHVEAAEFAAADVSHAADGQDSHGSKDEEVEDENGGPLGIGDLAIAQFQSSVVLVEARLTADPVEPASLEVGVFQSSFDLLR